MASNKVIEYFSSILLTQTLTANNFLYLQVILDITNILASFKRKSRILDNMIAGALNSLFLSGHFMWLFQYDLNGHHFLSCCPHLLIIVIFRKSILG